MEFEKRIEFEIWVYKIIKKKIVDEEKNMCTRKFLFQVYSVLYKGKEIGPKYLT